MVIVKSKKKKKTGKNRVIMETTSNDKFVISIHDIGTNLQWYSFLIAFFSKYS